MQSLLISDLHLQPEDPKNLERFQGLLDFCKKNIQSLYILGDLFEVFLGDDDDSEFTQLIIKALADCSAAGVKLYILRGNRDFLIGTKFIKTIGAVLLPDPCILELHGKTTLLTHGDQLCTQDKSYQRYRQIIQHPLTLKLATSLPLWLRQWAAKKLRRRSHDYQLTLDSTRLDVDAASLKNWLTQYQCQQIIHGHTHRPSIHCFWQENKSFVHYVLSDWHGYGNALLLRDGAPPLLINFDDIALSFIQ